MQKSERGPPQTCGLAVDLDIEVDLVGNLGQVLLSLTNQQPNTTVSCLDPDPTDSVSQKLAQASEIVISTSNPAQSLIRSGENTQREVGGANHGLMGKGRTRLMSTWASVRAAAASASHRHTVAGRQAARAPALLLHPLGAISDPHALRRRR